MTSMMRCAVGVDAPSFRPANGGSSKELSKVEAVVFCLLVFLSSFARLPANSLTGLSGTFSSNGFLILCAGVILMLFSRGNEGLRSSLVRRFLALTMLLMLINLGMSLYLAPAIGTMYGESPLTTGLTTLCWLACHAVAIVYICYCYSTIPLKTLGRVFDLMLVFVLIVSLLQVGAVIGLPGFRAFYDATNVGGWFQLASYNYERVCGVASEPSGMATVIGMLCFPYAASMLLHTRKWRYGLTLLMLVFIAYFTFSSTVYVSLLFSLVAFLVVYFASRGGKIPKGVIVATMVALVVALLVGLVVCSHDDFKDNEIINSISILFEKVTDDTNQSTAYRNSTVTNDIKIFLDHPVFGVGEGNQGYFYVENLDSSVLNSGSGEAQDAVSGKIGVLNGGSFLPSLISGFGLVGTIAYAAWVISGARQAGRYRARLGIYYQMYLLALAGGLPMLWIGIGFSGLPIVLFLVLGIPFMGERADSKDGVVIP